MAAPGPVLFQYFHWYISNEGNFWNELAVRAPELAQIGISAVWFPPCHKGLGGVNDVGYGSYDLYDLGQFKQKGRVRTKYGTRSQLVKAVRAVRDTGMSAYADIVLNHLIGADEEEDFIAQPISCDDRRTPQGEPRPFRGWTVFRYPGRKGKYSEMVWNWWHFNAVNGEVSREAGENILLLEGKRFADDVCGEYGNHDYLLGCDIDHSHPEVRDELRRWGKWFIETTGFNGLRLDALKHISCGFYREWLAELRDRFPDQFLFTVGEYWSGDLEELNRYLDTFAAPLSLFDVPLHFRFHRASREGRDFPLNEIFDGTLVRTRPMQAVTFVENHDTQRCQSLESPVEDWFKPLAYALILLRESGYPCIFYADYYGARYREGDIEVEMPSHRFLIDRFLKARREFAYGEQRDYTDHPTCIGWVRLGDSEHPGAMAVVMSNGDDGFKTMSVDRPDTVFCDLTGHCEERIVTDGEGKADFPCRGGSVSVWIPYESPSVGRKD
ncbi:MAG: alpha-amylase [Capsulimonadales bacterium]|nr:alpha-amylase [Capsulimonadales bacterium]